MVSEHSVEENPIPRQQAANQLSNLLGGAAEEGLGERGGYGSGTKTSISTSQKLNTLDRSSSSKRSRGHLSGKATELSVSTVR
jgi:hypothetical protein